MAKADIRTCYTSRKRNGIRLYNSLVRKVEVERGRKKKRVCQKCCLSHKHITTRLSTEYYAGSNVCLDKGLV